MKIWQVVLMAVLIFAAPGPSMAGFVVERIGDEEQKKWFDTFGDRLPREMENHREKLLAHAQTLVETLAHYGVQGKVEDILPGPTVTTYEVSPAAGTKVSKVAGLADDLALALARKVRIVAPIPFTARCSGSRSTTGCGC